MLNSSLYKAKKQLLMGFIVLVISALYLPIFFPIFASETTNGLANYLLLSQANTDNISVGTIIVRTDGEYKVSSEPYQFKLIGVVTENPPVAIDFTTNQEGTPVAVSGVNDVLVSTENGQIEEGDLLTSSSKPGVAMKAIKAGYVLGIAMQDYKPENNDTIETIPVALEVDYSYNPAFRSQSMGEAASKNLKDILTLSSVAVYESPVKIFRYLMVAAIIFASLAFAFLTFSRVARNGVEAIGRNPLAKGQIQTGIIINIVLSLVVVMSGAGVAYLILVI